MRIQAGVSVTVAAAGLLTSCMSVREPTPEGKPSPDIRMASYYGAGDSEKNAPKERLAGSDATTLATADKWWKEFGDERLNHLIDRVLEVNTDLASAGLLVERARLIASLAFDDRLPKVDTSVSIGTSKALASGSSSVRSSSASLGLRYEIDLWGRLRSQHDAAAWEVQATEEDLLSTRLVLIGTASDLYWTLAFLNQRIAAGEESLQRVERTLSLVRVQRAAGAVSRLEVQEAEQSLYSQTAAQSALIQRRVEARNALTVLLNGEPWPMEDEPQDLKDAQSPRIEPGVPAEILGRRPDLRAAELRVREFFVAIDTTRASYYPAVTLDGSVGGSSTSLRDVLSNPVGVLGAGLVLPFLNWREMKLNTRIARTDYEIAVNEFRAALYTAFTEVDNALSARAELSNQMEAARQSFEAAREVERLYEVRYQAGATSLRVWLDAQEVRRSAELALAQARLEQLVNDSVLLRALGGGTTKI